MGTIWPIFTIFLSFIGCPSEKKFHSDLTTFIYLHVAKSGKIPRFKAKSLWQCDRNCPFSNSGLLFERFTQKTSLEPVLTFFAQARVATEWRIPKFRVELRSTKIWRFFCEKPLPVMGKSLKRQFSRKKSFLSIFIKLSKWKYRKKRPNSSFLS